jgi:hypothetical protein
VGRPCTKHDVDTPHNPIDDRFRSLRFHSPGSRRAQSKHGSRRARNEGLGRDPLHAQRRNAAAEYFENLIWGFLTIPHQVSSGIRRLTLFESTNV